MFSKIFLTSALLSTLFFSTTNAQRKVLVEQFTNSGCPPCAGNTPVVASYVNSNPGNALMLAYHASFPYNDSMYFENAVQNDARVAYYGLFSVPHSRVDGNYFAGDLVPTIATTIPARASVAPKYSITFSSSMLNNSGVQVNVQFQSIDSMNQNESLTAMVVVAERNVLKSAYLCCPGSNSEIEYPWVVRKMLPDENGTTLFNKQFNGIDNVQLSWTASNFKDLGEMRVIAFVQNTVTKEVYQAEISTPLNTTAVNELHKTYGTLFTLSAGIASDHISVQFKKLSEGSSASICDLLGKSISSQALSASLSDKSLEFPISDLQDGIYFIRVQNENTVETKKFIVTKK
ncbi:hypothetical protein BH11BAC1_BH11BAC1_12980 [soil metagenome]